MKIFDTVTGDELDIYCEKDSEIYRAVEEKAIQSIMHDFDINREKAINMLACSSIGNEIFLTDGNIFWAE